MSSRAALTRIQVLKECMFADRPLLGADLQTIHIDDLSRNFAMNPANGIKVGAPVAGAR